MFQRLTHHTDVLLALIRNGQPIKLGQQLQLAACLSFPAIVAQLSAIAMQYIDASMVGHLGAEPAAAIGIVSTTTWLFWGLTSSAASGFTVQVAHAVGAHNFEKARRVVREGLVCTFLFSLAQALVGVVISRDLPAWLGGDAAIQSDASAYFLLFALFLPALQLNFLAGGFLRCSGNMHVPSVAGVTMCVLDVMLNFLFIFLCHMGVVGAALGTALAETLTGVFLLWYLFHRSALQGNYKAKKQETMRGNDLRRLRLSALRISLPMTFEHVAICGAQIATTVIVAPLGVVAIAANSFAVTAESLCYMPGYGIGEAATTLVGQSLGAGRRHLMRQFAWICVGGGMAVMAVMGVLMYAFAPGIIALMTPVEAIRTLGTDIMRIEAWAEPMFAASIVAYGAFVGAGRTLIPSLMNFGSIWGVRLTLALVLAPMYGLPGVWLAMCIELCFRGVLFLLRLFFSLK